MSPTDQASVEERLRTTYAVVTTTTSYPPPPLLSDVELPATPMKVSPPRRRSLVVVLTALVVIGLVVGGVLVTKNGDDGRGKTPKVVPPAEQPLFPDYPPHQGAPLLLAPSAVPTGFKFVSAEGPDERGGIELGVIPGQVLQYWLLLDATGQHPVSGFTVGWGPANPEQALKDAGRSIPGLPNQSDALQPFQLRSVPITVAGHDAFYDQFGQTIAWEEQGQVVHVGALQDSWVGTWPSRLGVTDLQTIANDLVRTPDGTYDLRNPPAGYQLVGQQPPNTASSSASSGPSADARQLIYSDGANHGFSIALSDDVAATPGVALAEPPATLVNVRGVNAVLTPFINGGNGLGCGTNDLFLCSTRPADLSFTYLQWTEPDNTTVTITSIGLTQDQVLDLARGLKTVTSSDWQNLVDNSATPR